MLQEVPEQHMGAWANAWTEVLRKISVAETDEDKASAILWLSFIALYATNKSDCNTNLQTQLCGETKVTKWRTLKG
jgi:hypothetical protein